MKGTTMTGTINYSGMLYSKTNEATRFLDAVYARGRAGGRAEYQSTEFVLASSYQMDKPEQPSISEKASLTAPGPVTTERTQEYNVCQIFQQAVQVSYAAQGDGDSLGGVNTAGAQNAVPDVLDFQIGRRLQQIRADLNQTLLNGVYQYTKGSATVAPKTRGIISAITTNRFDAAAAKFSPKLLDKVLRESIANGADPTAFEIWVNPEMLSVINEVYSALPGGTLPASRTEAGVAYNQILTSFAPLAVHWDMQVPEKKILLVNMGQMAVAEKPVPGKGALFYEELAKRGAAYEGQLYGEMGCDYGAEWHHALLENLGG